MGKSLVVRQAALIAEGLGRVVHLLRWDVARLVFDTPRILARYPEVAGVTHPAIRLAVGEWARAAVLRWHDAHGDPAHILIGETPLVGERLMSLVRPRHDRVEPLLAAAATLFLVPVPSPDVRRAVEGSRARDMAAPAHARDAASAAPHLVRWHWDDLARVAGILGVPRADPPSGYDPELYAAVYQRLLRHRRSLVMPIARVLSLPASVHEVRAAGDLVPTPAEVAAAMARVAGRTDDDVERDAARWYEV